MQNLFCFASWLLLTATVTVSSTCAAFQLQTNSAAPALSNSRRRQHAVSTSSLLEYRKTLKPWSNDGGGGPFPLSQSLLSQSQSHSQQKKPKQKKKQRQVYKHLFRHYEDISFDSWLRCAEPEEFLLSVGYAPLELEQISQAYEPLLTLDVHAQLAPKIRFLVETLGGGTGRMTWNHENEDTIAAQDDKEEEEECPTPEEDAPVVHSMRLHESTKQVVPANFFACQLDRIVGPHHAYLMHHQLLPTPSLLSDPEAFQLFLDVSASSSKTQLEDFAELCNAWEKKKGGTTIHTVNDIQEFEMDFTPGLIPASKQAVLPNSGIAANTIMPLQLQHGANPFEYDTQGILPLHWAAGGGNLQGVQAIINVKHEDYEDDFPYSVVFDILDNAREPKEGATPFHWACCGVTMECIGKGGSLDLCDWMLTQAGEEKHVELANLKTWTSQNTPLMYAAWAGSLDICDLLVTHHGADPSMANQKGQTAMHWAASAGHLDVCQYLLEQPQNNQKATATDADADATTESLPWPLQLLTQADASGQTPLDHAKRYDQTNVVDWMTELLLHSNH